MSGGGKWDDLENFVTVSEHPYAPTGFICEWPRLTAIAVTSQPTKTTYSNGEAIDYSGIVVTATYSNMTTKEVSDKCVIAPAEGKAFTPDSDTEVTITYTENKITASTVLILISRA